MDNMDQEKGMNERGDMVPQGPAQEEVNDVNQQKGPLRRPGFLGKIVNAGLALGMFGSVAALKVKAEENTVNQAPPQVEPSNNQEIKNTPPSAPGVKVEFPTADAPVPDASAPAEFKPTTSRVFLPKVEKNYSEAPLRFLTRIERPDAKLTIFTDEEGDVRQGGLIENLVEFRKIFGPSLPLEVYFYESLDELQKRFGDSSGIPWEQRIVQITPYDIWASTVNIYDDQGNRIETRQFPPTFEARGQIQYRVRDGQVVEVHVSLPKLLPGVQPDPLQIDAVERKSQTEVMMRVFTLDENGESILSKISGTSDSARALGREVGQYLRDHPLYTLKPNQRLDQVALHVIS